MSIEVKYRLNRICKILYKYVIAALIISVIYFSSLILAPILTIFAFFFLIIALIVWAVAGLVTVGALFIIDEYRKIGKGILKFMENSNPDGFIDKLIKIRTPFIFVLVISLVLLITMIIINKIVSKKVFKYDFGNVKIKVNKKLGSRPIAEYDNNTKILKVTIYNELKDSEYKLFGVLCWLISIFGFFNPKYKPYGDVLYYEGVVDEDEIEITYLKRGEKVLAFKNQEHDNETNILVQDKELFDRYYSLKKLKRRLFILIVLIIVAAIILSIGIS